MTSKRKSRKVGLAFVDLQSDPFPESGRNYTLVDPASICVGDIPYPDTELKLLRVQVLSLYIEDLPDFRNRSEGLLTFAAVTRTRGDSANKEDLEYSLGFSVKNRDYAPGLLQRMVFRNVLVREFFDLGIDLVELDSQFADAYKKVSTVVDESGLTSIDAIQSVPYIKVATRLFGGLVESFGKNIDDVVWSEMPSLQFSPGPGGAFLRTGIYVLHEQRSLHQTKSARQRGGGKRFPLNSILFRDGRLEHADKDAFPLPNHLIFSIQTEPYLA